MLVYSFIVVNKNKNYCNFKDIDMSISPIEKFIILIEDVALLTKIFMGKTSKKANLVEFIWFVKYFFNVFAADFSLRKMFFRSTCCHLFYYGGFYPNVSKAKKSRRPVFEFRENFLKLKCL